MIRVFDVHGNELEATYPKRAKGLIKKGRAQWLGSVNHDDPDFVPDSIILYDNADTSHVPRTADIQQTEVQSMFNNEIINNEYIPENETAENTESLPAAEILPEMPEVPEESVDYQSLLEGIIASLNDISLKRLSDDPEIATFEAEHLKVQSETLRDAYHKTLNVRKESAQIAAYEKKQKLLAERIAKLEEEKSMMLKTIGKLYEDEQLDGVSMLSQIRETTVYYNDEISKLIAMMN